MKTLALEFSSPVRTVAVLSPAADGGEPAVLGHASDEGGSLLEELAKEAASNSKIPDLRDLFAASSQEWIEPDPLSQEESRPFVLPAPCRHAASRPEQLDLFAA